MKALLGYTRYLKAHRGLLVSGLIFSLIFGASSGFGIPAVFEQVFRPVLESEGNEYSTWEIVGLCLLLPGIFLVRGVTSFLGAYLLNMAGLHVLRSLQTDLFEKFQRLSLAFYDRHKTGDLISRVSNDTNAIRAVLLEFASDSVRQTAQMLAAFVFLIYLTFHHEDVVFLFLFLAALPVLVLPVRLVRKRVKQRGREMMESLGDLTGHLSENFSAIQEVRAFNQEPVQQKGFRAKVDAFIHVQLKLIKYQKLQQPLMELIAVMVVSLVFGYALVTDIPVETFTAMGLALYFGLDPVKRLFNLLNTIHRTEGAMERINNILQLEETVADLPEAQPVDRLQGHIQTQDLCFAYGEETVLHDLSLSIEPGTVCAIVGPSGAGKSTFAKLLPRFYDAKSGSLRYDGIDIRSMRLADLRRNLAIVPQQTVLFNATIADNIRLGRPEASDAVVEAAAKKAFAHDFIAELPQGYQTLVGERGDRLSGGQKQRIALARAFLKDAPILLLDEPTSALDAVSERYIQQAMEALMRGKTVLIIAHRLSTIRHADRILVFEGGRLMDDAPHEALMTRSEHYRELVRNQAV
ncbi:MAG: ABC transporter ATP-binding protein [Opitutales bacterium]